MIDIKKLLLSLSIIVVLGVQVFPADKVDSKKKENGTTGNTAKENRRSGKERGGKPTTDKTDGDKAAKDEFKETPKDSWPLFRGNVLSTGVASSTLPDNPKLVWKYTVPKGAFEGTPVVVDGVVYIGDL